MRADRAKRVGDPNCPNCNSADHSIRWCHYNLAECIGMWRWVLHANGWQYFAAAQAFPGLVTVSHPAAPAPAHRPAGRAEYLNDCVFLLCKQKEWPGTSHECLNDESCSSAGDETMLLPGCSGCLIPIPITKAGNTFSVFHNQLPALPAGGSRLRR